ncbi:MAG TPA: hypothetical protein VJS45_15780, partial [Acidimicrobiia bacterium]|nr:hypothetical protein [Acidimicrobiia bacterium]
MLIASFAAGGLGQSLLSAAGPAGGDQRSAAVAGIAPGWSDGQGIVPVKPQVKATPGHERGVRVKLPLLLGAVGLAWLAGGLARRPGFRR